MNKETLYELRSLVALYPYYQTARLLMLTNMYLLHDTAFDDELRRAALYVSDRRLLFDLVEGARYKIKTVAEKAAEEAAEAARRKKEVDANRTISIIDKSVRPLTVTTGPFMPYITFFCINIPLNLLLKDLIRYKT